MRVTKPGEFASVDCNGCTLCCWNAMIPLMPEDGDPANWKTQTREVPLDGEMVRFHYLAHNDDGSCVYLNEARTGCTIHKSQPRICQQFSCVEAFKFYPRNKRREYIKRGLVDKRVFDEGRKRAMGKP